MPLFFDYSRPGPGVNPDEPRKKGFLSLTKSGKIITIIAQQSISSVKEETRRGSVRCFICSDIYKSRLPPFIHTGFRIDDKGFSYQERSGPRHGSAQ